VYETELYSRGRLLISHPTTYQHFMEPEYSSPRSEDTILHSHRRENLISYTAPHLFVSITRPIYSTPSHPTFLRTVLMFSLLLRLHVSSGRFPTNIIYGIFPTPFLPLSLPIISFLIILITNMLQELGAYKTVI
jgi:hypothetical protein